MKEQQGKNFNYAEWLGTYNETQAGLLQDFIFVMRDFRKELTGDEIILREERHHQIVGDCIDNGLIREICDIRDKWIENRV